MEMSGVYPLRAGLTGIRGEVVLACEVAVTGSLENCRVESETPTGYGFGEAGLKLSRKVLMRPMLKDGQPVGGASVTLPLVFMPRSIEARMPGLTESLDCLGRLSAAAEANPTDEFAMAGAGWARYWANKLMKRAGISKDVREKRLSAAAAKRGHPGTDADARCRERFNPEPQS